MRVSRATRRLALVAAAVAGTVVLAASPAAAASIYFYSTNGTLLGHGYALSAGRYYVACDDYADGVGIRTEVRLSSGYSDSVGDGNGSKAGCGEEHPAGMQYVTSFRVCAGASYCTAWKNYP